MPLPVMLSLPRRRHGMTPQHQMESAYVNVDQGGICIYDIAEFAAYSGGSRKPRRRQNGIYS